MTKLLGIGLIIASNLSFGAYAGPLLQRSRGIGFAPAHSRMSESCEVYSDKILLRRYTNGISLVETKTTKLDGNLFQHIEEVYKAHQNGEVESGPQIMDAPMISYTAFRINPNDSIAQVPVGLYVGFQEKGTQQKITKGTAARTIENFLDLVCQ